MSGARSRKASESSGVGVGPGRGRRRARRDTDDVAHAHAISHHAPLKYNFYVDLGNYEHYTKYSPCTIILILLYSNHHCALDYILLSGLSGPV